MTRPKLKNITKALTVTVLCLIGLYGSYRFCYYLAENYFFDKFFYRTSDAYGYWGKDNQHPNFGARNSDILALQSGKRSPGTQDNSYVIAVVGDSYVWGTGLKNSDRFAQVLQDKLNKIRPTKVISLGEAGNGILDHLRWYDRVTSTQRVDLFIFSLIGNDFFVDFPSSNFTQADYRNIIADCQKTNTFLPTSLVHNLDIFAAADQGHSIAEVNQMAYSLELQAKKNPTNLCVMQKALSLLPTAKGKSIYFFPESYQGLSSGHLLYIQMVLSSDKNIIFSEAGKNLPQYSKYWKLPDFPYNKLKVSRTEQHPNATANRIYADILFSEITTKPEYGFTNTK